MTRSVPTKNTVGPQEFAWAKRLNETPLRKDMETYWANYGIVLPPPDSTNPMNLWWALAILGLLRRDHGPSPLSQEEEALFCEKTVIGLSGTDLLFRPWGGPELPESVRHIVAKTGLDWDGIGVLAATAAKEGWEYLNCGTAFHALRQGQIVAKIPWGLAPLPPTTLLDYSLAGQSSLFAPVLGQARGVIYQAFGGRTLTDWGESEKARVQSQEAIAAQVDTLRPFWDLGLFPDEMATPDNCCLTEDGRVQVIDADFEPLRPGGTWEALRQDLLTSFLA